MSIGVACPVIAGVTIEAEGFIPVNQNDVSGILNISLYIPDFEGRAILRIFSNSTQAEIGCYAAQIMNGNTFRQKTAVGAVLGVFTATAMISSFTTAIYGNNIVEMRKHYAHSVSVMVVFSVWHHIYFSGAPSMKWPGALVSFWSNYACAGGMIYSEHMQNIINEFIRSNKGNTSHLGATGNGVNNPDLDDGYSIQVIYKREMDDRSRDFSYTGKPVKPGLPIPGNFSGFPGTLAQERIPASNAFMTCLLWSLILVVCLVASIATFKALLEAFSKMRLLKRDSLAYFRAHFIRYTTLTVLRVAFLGFFMTAFVSMFQLSYLRSTGPVAVACVVFFLVVFGTGTAAGLACYRKVRGGGYLCERNALIIEERKVCKFIPWFKVSRQSEASRSEDKAYVGTIPWWTLRSSSGEKSVHDDEKFIRSFGWLVSRYRPTRWWFFALWLLYEFTRACLLAGASSQPLIQVFGLLGVECIALIVVFYLRPFEGQRLNIILAYSLGSSKVTTTALAATLDMRFNLPRILATVIGIVIIVIQGLLTLVVLFAIISGAITTSFSVSRDQEEVRPRGWMPVREKYFKHLNGQADDIVPRRRSVSVMPMQEAQKGSYFSVNRVQRVPKVEDEDVEFVQEIYNDCSVSRTSVLRQDEVEPVNGLLHRSRAGSDTSQTSQSSLPRAARVHRPTWKSHDFAEARVAGRTKTLSKTTSSTPEYPERPTSVTVPQLDGASSGSENVVGRSESFLPAAIQPESAAYKPILHPFAEKDGMSPAQRSGRKPSVHSWSSSTLPMEAATDQGTISPMCIESSNMLQEQSQET
ncbi:hypothetical protein HBH56_147150 [Parastagonospora nodorum]|uniref:ML-like domain-containing protein n=2 Tax=Phaeosphaeria nodorum (strain SN15 / ATCC MYA-4574 / FGSC 10173) TaxID=321614 RepID=Q0ULR5_PHANO|nr:hypothetical protein SNOG_07299 [Parastagonospora nodorum SN15]KAH3910102.1 hypothetical protein HBH56_147150 [Parastagonospora nodorum]EAT84765.1 hypothetical protein SNOG_07299 [Parastagonospora nodorum SN15]KAH3923209.1 hypothetical protein HBH54_211790 [Parastagonospora nodorum]KAH3946073.1 hypothetical protein HBH53_134610 [Parastagonospora nodorum]KAH3984176.1 hypothetical protein HBH52_065430 [Parastagonospora nodorum]